MLLSFTVLQAMGITLNMVVLFSLTLALGMLVDNAIVIVENSYRFMEQGANSVEAAMKATSEVAYPVMASTLTTLAAFSPMLFWPGIMGEFMSYLPLTLIITLSSSLFVAMVINPAMVSLFMKVKKSNLTVNGESAESEISAVEKPVEIRGFLLTRYTRTLSRALETPFSIIGIGFCLLVLMFQGWQLAVGLRKPVEFFPDIDPKGIYVNIDVPEGADIDYIDRITQRIELSLSGEEVAIDGAPIDDSMTVQKALSPKEHKREAGPSHYGPSDMPNVESIYMKATVQSDGGSAFAANTPNHIGIRFLEMQDRWRSSQLDVDEIRKRIKNIPGGKLTIAKEAEGPPTGAPINIEIVGDNFAVLGEISRKIKDVLETIPHVDDVRDDFVEGIPSVQVHVDRQKAALFGTKLHHPCSN